MGTIRPQQNQNILDVALQEYGSIETVFDVLADNDRFDLTDDLSVYQDLQTGREAFKKDIVAYYNANTIKPATSSTREEELLLADLSGVDFMIVEEDFFIS
ncbi:hypothetical protein [uncultured Dokdonia sp.]|uniref:hypothetical protein n=1 Tax=uncultured Dokdonia sp. TaxID=575653 RepID=UPI00262897B9|nr:hypothetical protein [uncultured Dokdonia sp.]